MKKKTPWRLLTAEKGSVLLYFLSFLIAFCSAAMLISQRMQRYLQYCSEIDAFERMNHAEVLTVYKIRQDFKLYQETDETFIIDGCLITVSYSSTAAQIEISYQDYVRQRVLEYDMACECICDYY